VQAICRRLARWQGSSGGILPEQAAFATKHPDKLTPINFKVSQRV
jgi:hypothetical protein